MTGQTIATAGGGSSGGGQSTATSDSDKEGAAGDFDLNGTRRAYSLVTQTVSRLRSPIGLYTKSWTLLEVTFWWR